MAKVSKAEREERVKTCAELVKQGLTRKEIAQRLGVSLPTVFNYIKLAKELGLLDEKEKEQEEENEFARDLRALLNNAPVIESLVFQIDFNRPWKEVLKQVEEIKRLFNREISALGFLAIICEGENEDVERRLMDWGVDIKIANQLRMRFAKILRHAKALFIRDHVGIENKWREVRTKRMFNFSREEPLIEIEIDTDFETFKTRDRLDSFLRLIVKLLYQCALMINEISTSGLSMDSEIIRRCEENLKNALAISEKALEDLKRVKEENMKEKFEEKVEGGSE